MSDNTVAGESDQEEEQGRKEEQPPTPDEEPKAESQKKEESAAGKKGADKNAFGAFVDGTTCFAIGMGEVCKGVAHVFSGRDHVVMARVNADSLKRIDQLVDAGIFRSRSESAAYLIARGIEADAALFETVEGRVEEINRLREELKKMVTFDDE